MKAKDKKNNKGINKNLSSIFGTVSSLFIYMKEELWNTIY